MKKGRMVFGAVILYFIVATGIYCVKMNSDPISSDVVEETTEAAIKPETAPDYEVIANNDKSMDIISRHSLPQLERMEKEDQDMYINNLQVIKKIEQLGLDAEDFLYPEISVSNIEAATRAKGSSYYDYSKRVDFSGATSQELQQVIDDNPNATIEINSEQIRVTEAVVLHDNIIINGNGVRFIGEGVACGFIAQSASGICLNNIIIEGKIDYAMYFVNCDNLNITQNTIEGCRQKAMCIIGPTSRLIIQNNKMSSNQAGALYIAGDVSQGLVEDNIIINNDGNSNWMAGIVLTNAVPTNGGDIWSVFDDQHQFPIIDGKDQLDCPHNILIRNNEIADNTSVGIYSDGAYMCYLLNNMVCQNDKGGISLNHGTIGFYLSENILEYNGCRMSQSDDDLKFDFVYESGRMEDGSAKAKLPGISLDNAVYNIIENNNISNNYGGGIKMVHTAIRNLVMGNVIKDNNIGKNDAFSFYGIELGVSSQGIENVGVDYTADYENIICKNIISGKHHSGTFIAEGCYINDVFDNVVMDSEAYGIEAVSQKFNSIVNNTTNCGVYNEFQ